ncbi:MAG: hypothetical protein RLZ33_1741 [Bacteroidota bacterium]|jgi:hypothetical protein
MKSISTPELIENLTSVSPKGLEVALAKGILRSTKCMYFREDSIFEYTNELRFDFKPSDAIPLNDFRENYSSARWLVEQEVG